MSKRREWLERYIPAEILGTVIALAGAWATYSHTHSYTAATAAGWIGEGIGFYGYFITIELTANASKYKDYPFIKRTSLAIAAPTSFFTRWPSWATKPANVDSTAKNDSVQPLISELMNN